MWSSGPPSLSSPPHLGLRGACFTRSAPARGSCLGLQDPKSLGLGDTPHPTRAALSQKEVLRPTEGARLAGGKRAKWELDPRLHRQREGIKANWRAAFPQLSGSLSPHPPTLRPRRTCLFSALAPAVFCLTLSRPARAQCPSALWSRHLGWGVLGNSWPWGLEPGSETKGEAK